MKKYLQELLANRPLSEDETSAIFKQFVLAEDCEAVATDAQVGAYLFATASRNLSADELVGAARVLRDRMRRLDLSFNPGLKILDTCGTGGSGLNSFNTSTAVSLLLAAAGQTVAKHGNRAVSSACGSADVLEALGVKIDLPPEFAADCLRQTGFCFMFAPLYHPATKRVQLLRKELGFRTIFNVLGPLLNPAQAKLQLLGVSKRELLEAVASALLRLGTERALVVNGDDGLDEFSISAPTAVIEINTGLLRSFSLTPEDFGFKRVPIAEVQGLSAMDSARVLKGIFQGVKSSYRNLVLINSSAAFYLSGKSASITQGVRLAEEVIDSGKVLGLLDELVRITGEYKY